MEKFMCKTQICAGNGAMRVLCQQNIRRMLLVCDPFFLKNGVAKQVMQMVKPEKGEIFGDIVPDPSVELVATGTQIVKSLQPDTVVALGGGSAMDCAKAMVFFSGQKIRLIAVPTTSGSGSEVTNFSILTHNGVKHPLVDDSLQPDMAILDGDLLKELPRSLIADGGFDVLSHALEACVAKNAGAITAALSQKAFSVVLDKLPDSFAGDKTVRQEIHTAATMAGIAFSQAGLGICHALAHSLGGQFHIPHGRLNAILLPSVVAFNARAAAAQYGELARSAGLPGSADTLAVRNLKNALIRLRRELQMPETLAQAGVNPQTLREKSGEIIRAALADPCCATNPIVPDAGTMGQILSEVAGRG